MADTDRQPMSRKGCEPCWRHSARGSLGQRAGGGMYLSSSFGTVSARGNTIVGNAAESGGFGSGVCFWAETDDTRFFGNVIAFSTMAEGLFIPPTNEAVADYDCVFGNAGGDYGGVAQPGAHDINTDPLFIQNSDPGPDGEWGTEDDDYGDLRLQPGSPCIDAALNSAVPADTTDLDDDGDTSEPIPLDLDGNARFVDDPGTAVLPSRKTTAAAKVALTRGKRSIHENRSSVLDDGLK